jgi:hypothetical protein
MSHDNWDIDPPEAMGDATHFPNYQGFKNTFSLLKIQA